MADALHVAARDGDLARLRAVLASGVDVNTRDSLGWTALRWAALEGHTACLEALLAAGASVHSCGFDGTNPLHYASLRGHIACVRALIAAGSDVNIACWPCCRPFSEALHRDRRRVLKILLRAGANVVTNTISRANTNAESWKLVDAIRKVGDWPEYVRRRRATVASVVKKVTHGALPDAINLEIAALIEPPGGY